MLWNVDFISQSKAIWLSAKIFIEIRTLSTDSAVLIWIFSYKESKKTAFFFFALFRCSKKLTQLTHTEGSSEATRINNMLIRAPPEAGLWVREGEGGAGRGGGGGG